MIQIIAFIFQPSVVRNIVKIYFWKNCFTHSIECMCIYVCRCRCGSDATRCMLYDSRETGVWYSRRFATKQIEKKDKKNIGKYTGNLFERDNFRARFQCWFYRLCIRASAHASSRRNNGSVAIFIHDSSSVSRTNPFSPPAISHNDSNFCSKHAIFTGRRRSPLFLLVPLFHSLFFYISTISVIWYPRENGFAWPRFNTSRRDFQRTTTRDVFGPDLVRSRVDRMNLLVPFIRRDYAVALW